MELRREAFRQTRPHPSSTLPTRGLYEALDDIEIAQLAPGPNRVLVLEWLDVGGAGAYPQVTVLRPAASPQVLDLPPLELKASSVATAILDRLEHWVGDGDPFNLDSWSIVERWVKEALGPQIRPNDHVVVIEDHSASHLPWHVALGPFAPASYAASWSNLLRIAAMEIARGDKGLGVSMVPRQDENEVIRVAFETAYVKLGCGFR
jgi:hypothetical protein